MPKSAIVLISSSYPWRADGSEAAGGFAAELAERIAEEMPVRVVAPGPTESQERLGPQLEVFRFAAPVGRALSTLRPWHPRDALTILRVLRSGLRSTMRAVAAGPTQHLLALWALPCGAWAQSASRRHGLPYSVWALGSDIWSLSRIPWVRGQLCRVLRGAAHRFADGIALAEETERLCQRPVAFLPSARRRANDPPPPLRTDPPYRLLYLGRWHPNKGIDLLIDALSLLGEEDWRRIEAVELAGDGPLAPMLRERIQALQAAGRPIECPGFLDRERALKALRRADFILIPSRIESIPLVFSDALAAGRPVLSMPVGDLPRLLREYACGLLARDLSAAAFAAALGDALARGPQGFAKALSRAAEDFDLQRIAAKLLSCVG